MVMAADSLLLAGSWFLTFLVAASHEFVGVWTTFLGAWMANFVAPNQGYMTLLPDGGWWVSGILPLFVATVVKLILRNAKSTLQRRILWLLFCLSRGNPVCVC